MVSVNLAIAMSKEIHKKAVLVDADLRKPAIHVEQSKIAKGLSHYLSEGASLSDVLMDSEVRNLKVIMAGNPSPRSSELIGSRKMAELLTLLGKSDEGVYTLLDSPPIISTTEPTLLSRMVEGIILVVMADRVPRESVERALRSIDREKIIGIVFNKSDVRRSGYYSGYDYKHYRKSNV